MSYTLAPDIIALNFAYIYISLPDIVVRSDLRIRVRAIKRSDSFAFIAMRLRVEITPPLAPTNEWITVNIGFFGFGTHIIADLREQIIWQNR
jgi:hypothetical protein